MPACTCLYTQFLKGLYNWPDHSPSLLPKLIRVGLSKHQSMTSYAVVLGRRVNGWCLLQHPLFLHLVANVAGRYCKLTCQLLLSALIVPQQ